jgi:hypothetical protein
MSIEGIKEFKYSLIHNYSHQALKILHKPDPGLLRVILYGVFSGSQTECFQKQLQNSS